MGVYAIKEFIKSGKESKQAELEKQRRKNTPVRFTDGITHDDFVSFVEYAEKQTPRVASIQVNGANVHLKIKLQSQLSVWAVDIDFNDYRHLSGKYWIEGDQHDSAIPEHFAEIVSGNILSKLGHDGSIR